MIRIEKVQKNKLLLAIILISIFELLIFPLPTLANNEIEINQDPELYYKMPESLPTGDQQISGLSGQENENSLDSGSANNEPYLIADEANLPGNKDAQTKSLGIRQLTAYTSEAGQCDASPCITASGFNLCEHNIEDTVAANFLPLGTRIMIPELFGDRIFVVRDRMSAKYQNRVDIWMKNKNDALQFGRRSAKIEILY